MTDDKKTNSFEDKSIAKEQDKSDDIKDKTVSKVKAKSRKLTATEKLEKLDNNEKELEDKLNIIKKKKEDLEQEIKKNLYLIIGQAVWEDIEDNKEKNQNEYSSKINSLKIILASKVKKRSDKVLLKSNNLMD